MPNKVMAYRRAPDPHKEGEFIFEAAEMWDANAHEAAANHPNEWALSPWPGQPGAHASAARPVEAEEPAAPAAELARPQMAVVEPGKAKSR